MAAPATNEPRINDRIRAREVRVVAADGEQIGIKPLPEALHMAREMDLDLVEVAPQADPPVCRIMDYGKYKYEAAQKAKESRRKASQVSIKEMKYRPKIGKGDFDTKTRKVEHFLEEGHKVKVTIMFRGREVHHPELGMRILDRIAETVDHLSKVEATPRLDGRNMTMVLAPDRQKREATARRKETDRSAAADGAKDAGAAKPRTSDGAENGATDGPADTAGQEAEPAADAAIQEPEESRQAR